ncbi:hypothetical protein RCH09_000308 [Actimicrobium sp. GrIS 1.19]|uniref:hypothetical protein n=1 Tax=Actimicrobium sp. GrIS 1.19 TaxID=3071708 RepID=UPI002E028CAD|nr:hypothetical protein [Actimicrobium sp. GrIS 1.19]
MKSMLFAPSIDHFSIPSLARLGKSFSASARLDAPEQGPSIGLAVADIADVSRRVTKNHGLKVKRRVLPQPA